MKAVPPVRLEMVQDVNKESSGLPSLVSNLLENLTYKFKILKRSVQKACCPGDSCNSHH